MGSVVHSDRGSHYARDAQRALLTRHHVQASMSRKGNCWDNAVTERFFKHCFQKSASQALYEAQLRPFLLAYLRSNRTPLFFYFPWVNNPRSISSSFNSRSAAVVSPFSFPSR
jgi:transposase InsO family protein